MAEIRPAKPKRPACPVCSRPSRLCLCARIKTDRLENPVAVTVVQHSLEKKHPLNSARIALLCLKNATLSTVSDVSFDARFDIRLVESKPELGSVCGDVAHQVFVKCPQKRNSLVFWLGIMREITTNLRHVIAMHRLCFHAVVNVGLLVQAGFSEDEWSDKLHNV